MLIKNITLVNYRNIEKINIDLSPDVNLFYGDNAQGKTNILEAIYICAAGRSHRTHFSRELIRFGEESAHIQLIVEKEGFSDKINIQIKNNNKKGIAINNMAVKSINELFGTVNVFFFSPQDLLLIKEGPALRRRYIDMELCQLSRLYAYDLSSYYRVLRERNIFLKNKPDKIMMDIYDEKLVEYGVRIISERERFVEGLNEFADRIHRDITGNKESLEVKYIKNVSADNFYDKLKYDLKRDILYGSTSHGIHKDDLVFNINGINARDYGSQGQQRTVCLSLKLAEIEIVKSLLGQPPVLLLDDVLSELDRSRQLYILDKIKNIQTVITSTGIDDLKDKQNVRIFNVKDGKVF